jgi:dephospho-CoA kinase
MVNKKLVLGVTGSFGSGKTTVCRFLRQLGADVVDADRIARQLILRGSSCYSQLISAFGPDILKKNKRLNRRKLAAQVFGDKKMLQRLNRVMHPAIIRRMRKELKDSTKKVVALDAPLLFECGLRKVADKVLVVKVSSSRQLQRLSRRLSVGRRGLLRVIKSQMPLAAKLRLADFIIDNNGSLEQTRKQVEKVWRLLWRN